MNEATTAPEAGTMINGFYCPPPRPHSQPHADVEAIVDAVAESLMEHHLTRISADLTDVMTAVQCGPFSDQKHQYSWSVIGKTQEDNDIYRYNVWIDQADQDDPDVAMIVVE